MSRNIYDRRFVDTDRETLIILFIKAWAILNARKHFFLPFFLHDLVESHLLITEKLEDVIFVKTHGFHEKCKNF